MRVGGGTVFSPIVTGFEPSTYGWCCAEEGSLQPLSYAEQIWPLQLAVGGDKSAGILLLPMRSSTLHWELWVRGSPIFLGTEWTFY